MGPRERNFTEDGMGFVPADQNRQDFPSSITALEPWKTQKAENFTCASPHMYFFISSKTKPGPKRPNSNQSEGSLLSAVPPTLCAQGFHFCHFEMPNLSPHFPETNDCNCISPSLGCWQPNLAKCWFLLVQHKAYLSTHVLFEIFRFMTKKWQLPFSHFYFGWARKCYTSVKSTVNEFSPSPKQFLHLPKAHY